MTEFIIYHKFFVSFFIMTDYTKIIDNCIVEIDGYSFDYRKHNVKHYKALNCINKIFENLKISFNKFNIDSQNYFDNFVENYFDYTYTEIHTALVSTFIYYFKRLNFKTKKERINNKIWVEIIKPYYEGLPKTKKHKEIIEKIELFLNQTLPEHGYKI